MNTSILHTPFPRSPEAPECQDQYRQMLIGQYKALSDKYQASAIKTVADAIVNKPELTKEDLYELELAMIQLEPKEQLARHAWALRSEFKSLVPEERYNEYIKDAPRLTSASDNPPAPLQDENALRADLTKLQEEIHWRQMLLQAVESYRSELVKSVCLTGLATLLVFALTVAFFRRPIGDRWGIDLAIVLSVVGAGVVGGLTSTLRRINDKSWRGSADIDLLKVQDSQLAVVVSPVLGGVFGVVMLFLFLGKLIEGGLFPHVDGESLMLGGMGIMDASDFAKLLVWSFVAGFAEQFVPDNLTRLVGQASVAKK